jgi:hypothetical protein
MHFQENQAARRADSILHMVQADPCFDVAAVLGKQFLHVGYVLHPVVNVDAEDQVARFHTISFIDFVHVELDKRHSGRHPPE